MEKNYVLPWVEEIERICKDKKLSDQQKLAKIYMYVGKQNKEWNDTIRRTRQTIEEWEEENLKDINEYLEEAKHF